MTTLRDRILNADDVQSETVDVPEWDAKVEVRSMTASARANLLEHFYHQRSNGDSDSVEPSWAELHPHVVIACAYDPESGERLFEPGDADALGAKLAGPVERIALAGMRLSGLTEEEADDAGKG